MEAESTLGSAEDALSGVSILERHPHHSELVAEYRQGQYQKILRRPEAQRLFAQFLDRLSARIESPSSYHVWTDELSDEIGSALALLTGVTSLNAFLQANVTGPPLFTQSLLLGATSGQKKIDSIRDQCLATLSTEGLSVYQHIPHVELFCFAKAIFNEYFPRTVNGKALDAKWMRIRNNAFHQRLLSSGTSNTRLSESAMELQTQIEADLLSLENEIMAPNSFYSTDSKVKFLLEKVQIYIMQGQDLKARQNVQQATTLSGFSFALSGALGKRTKFQQKDISQLVVFAKSKDDLETSAMGNEQSKFANLQADNLSRHPSESSTRNPVVNGPAALDLNDDTLLESIQFSKEVSNQVSALPAELASIKPDQQPQLKPLDQIILLTEATLKDTLSPLDKLNSEEILPYSVRVLADNPTNWQIYTQALLVRSRIESHRSRTQERSVLQLQAIVDQIIADSQEEMTAVRGNEVPQIQITQFLPRAKASAPVTDRLKYIYQLNTPTRWEIETELAYAWSNAGSLVSALEIFKRLKLWAEVSLCYHSVGQEEKAKQIVRRQLYQSSNGPDMDRFGVDAEEVAGEEWDGSMRTPPPPHAPRLWCILGDLEQDPDCWQRAWDISNRRFARAQRSLGEYYTRKGDLGSAREAYMKATIVNRQNSETWSRLGDIDLKVGNWDGAIIAYQQCIMIDDDNAKTYSNLGSALLSKHAEVVQLRKIASVKSNGQVSAAEANTSDDEGFKAEAKTDTGGQMEPKEILKQALIAYKRAASISYDNWQIWDNVITIAGRMTPPSFPEILMGMRAVIRIRSPTIGEDAVDIDILSALVRDITSRERPENGTVEAGIYVPPRGSLPRAVIGMVDEEIIPLITQRQELWALVEKLKLYRRDYAGALACAEKRWRIATAGEEWLEDPELWKLTVSVTDDLVSALENYGPQQKADGSGEVEKGWKMKARTALRGVLGKSKNIWGERAEYEELKERLEELKSA